MFLRVRYDRQTRPYSIPINLSFCKDPGRGFAAACNDPKYVFFFELVTIIAVVGVKTTAVFVT